MYVAKQDICLKPTWLQISKLVIGLVRLESLKPGFVDSRFESLISGFGGILDWYVCIVPIYLAAI